MHAAPRLPADLTMVRQRLCTISSKKRSFAPTAEVRVAAEAEVHARAPQSAARVAAVWFSAVTPVQLPPTRTSAPMRDPVVADEGAEEVDPSPGDHRRHVGGVDGGRRRRRSVGSCSTGRRSRAVLLAPTAGLDDADTHAGAVDPGAVHLAHPGGLLGDVEIAVQRRARRRWCRSGRRVPARRPALASRVAAIAGAGVSPSALVEGSTSAEEGIDQRGDRFEPAGVELGEDAVDLAAVERIAGRVGSQVEVAGRRRRRARSAPAEVRRERWRDAASSAGSTAPNCSRRLASVRRRGRRGRPRCRRRRTRRRGLRRRGPSPSPT